MIQKISTGDLSIPASWKLLTAADCREAAENLSAAQRKWMRTHEHSHAYFEVLAAVRGNCILKVEERIVQLREGEMILIAPRERHTSGHLPDGRAVYWWCLLAQERLEMLLWRHDRLDSIATPRIGEFSQTLTPILSELSDPAVRPYAEYEMVHFLSGLICHFFRKNPVRPDPQKSSFQDAVMQKILVYIDSSAAMGCTLNSLAAMAGYSRTHFQRLFREYTGRSFRDYRESKRLERYQRLCEKRNFSKKEISNVLGFSSTAALNHWERKRKAPSRI